MEKAREFQKNRNKKENLRADDEPFSGTVGKFEIENIEKFF